MNFGGRKNIRSPNRSGSSSKTLYLLLHVLDKFSATNITLAKYGGPLAFTTVLRVCKPGTEFIHILSKANEILMCKKEPIADFAN